MLKMLAVLVWPLGLAAILVVTALLARRPARHAVSATAAFNGHSGGDTSVASRSARSSIVGMLLILVVGALAVYGVTCLIGMLAVHAGPTLDKPVYHWMSGHRVHVWTQVMNRLTKIGDTWTTWGATAAAAVCLTVFYRRNKWLPPVVFAAAIVIDHYMTQAVRHTFHRLGPPDSPLGTFPSGGCDRIIVFYGLIAYLIWREIGHTKPAAVWSAGAVAALAFNEAYSRQYLTLHWTTDILSGLIYGTLILIVFIATIRLVLGHAPAGAPVLADRPADMSDQPAATRR